MHSKVGVLTQGCSGAKCSIYCRQQAKESRQLGLKRSELPDGFQGRVSKDGDEGERLRRGVGGVGGREAVHDHLVDILLIGW